MFIVRGFLDRVLLICAVIGGGLVPGFIAQYSQRLGGRLDQARLDLAPWQKIADQFYNGDIERLIQYHLDSRDPTFHSEGAIISSLVDTVHRLQAAVDALHTNLFGQATYLALHADPGLTRATLGDWVPTFAISTEGLIFAAVFALLVWLLFHTLWRLPGLVGRVRPGRRRVARAARVEPRLE